MLDAAHKLISPATYSCSLCALTYGAVSMKRSWAAWSTPETRAQTLAALRAHGLAVAEIAPWFDVDRIEDLERLRRMIESCTVDAPATARLLTSWQPRRL